MEIAWYAKPDEMAKFEQRVSEKNDEMEFDHYIRGDYEHMPIEVVLKYVSRLESKIGPLEDQVDELKGENSYLQGSLNEAVAARERLASEMGLNGMSSAEIRDLRTSINNVLTALDRAINGAN
jgi:hypothetical protein